MKKKYTLYFLIIFFLFSIPLRIDAVVAYPFPVEFKQPNGEIIIIQAHGDENFHYMTTEDGYLIDFDSNSGYFFYASIIDGRIVPGPAKVSAMKLKSTFGLLRSDSNEFLEKVKRPALTRIFEARMKGLQNSTIDLRSSTVIIGDRKALVILVNFKNVIFSVNNPHRSFDRMLNQVGYSENGGTGSARDFYIDNSNGQFTPDFNVYGPVDLPQNMEYYGENDANGNDKNAEQMIVDACQAAKTKYGATLNFADYDYDKDGKVDNIFVFYAGYNEAENSTTKPNTVWPHKSSVESKNVKIDGVLLTNYACTSELKESSGVKMAGIGTFTHEFGHVLGLPDFYDADGDANGNGVGLGYWSTMDKGNYLNGGNTPPYFSAIERYLLGWITLTEITATTNPQTKSLNPIKQSSTNQAFRLNTSTAEEFFVVVRSTW